MPAEVDCRVLETFSLLYTSSLRLILFKLFKLEGLRYPPAVPKAALPAGAASRHLAAHKVQAAVSAYHLMKASKAPAAAAAAAAAEKEHQQQQQAAEGQEKSEDATTAGDTSTDEEAATEDDSEHSTEGESDEAEAEAETDREADKVTNRGGPKKPKAASATGRTGNDKANKDLEAEDDSDDAEEDDENDHQNDDDEDDDENNDENDDAEGEGDEGSAESGAGDGVNGASDAEEKDSRSVRREAKSHLSKPAVWFSLELLPLWCLVYVICMYGPTALLHRGSQRRPRCLVFAAAANAQGTCQLPLKGCGVEEHPVQKLFEGLVFFLCRSVFLVLLLPVAAAAVFLVQREQQRCEQASSGCCCSCCRQIVCCFCCSVLCCWCSCCGVTTGLCCLCSCCCFASAEKRRCCLCRLSFEAAGAAWVGSPVALRFV